MIDKAAQILPERVVKELRQNAILLIQLKTWKSIPQRNLDKPVKNPERKDIVQSMDSLIRDEEALESLSQGQSGNAKVKISTLNKKVKKDLEKYEIVGVSTRFVLHCIDQTVLLML